MVTLDENQKAEFKRSGMLVLERAVPAEIVENARSEIESAIEVRTDDFEAMLQAENEINVWDRIEDERPFARICSGIFDYAEALVGEGTLQNLSSRMQIAIRYPNGRLRETYPRVEDELVGHLDGYNATYQRTGEVQALTLGATVYFDDVYPRGGGFTVWPGSHHQVAEYFESNELDSLDDGNFRQVEGSPFEVTGPAGTLVLWHNKLVHCGGVNVSNDPRYAGFVRLARTDIDSIKEDAASNLWKYWDGL